MLMLNRGIQKALTWALYCIVQTFSNTGDFPQKSQALISAMKD